jgi:hypothetical protein
MEDMNINKMGYLSKYHNFIGNRNVADFKIKELVDVNYKDIKIVVKSISKYCRKYRFIFPYHNDLFENNIVSIDNYNKAILGDGTTGNRIHISNIGDKLKGFGLAVKIYQKMIDMFGYISSNGTSTGSIQNVWRKLINSNEYSVLYYKGTIQLEYCAKCVNTPTKIKCPNCMGHKFECNYCNNMREVMCSHVKDNDNDIKEFIFISKDINIIHDIKKIILASNMVNPDNIFIY